MKDSDDKHPASGEDSTQPATGGSTSIELGKVRKALNVAIGKVSSHYTTFVPIGQGSFGQVHAARDALLGREVAIKSLKPQYRNEDVAESEF